MIIIMKKRDGSDLFFGAIIVLFGLWLLIMMPIGVKIVGLPVILVGVCGIISYVSGEISFLKGDLIVLKDCEKWHEESNTYKVLEVGKKNYLLENIKTKETKEIPFSDEDKYQKKGETQEPVKLLEDSKTPLNEFMVKTEKEKV